MKLFEKENSGDLYQKVLQLAGIFSAAGGRAVLVGGAVRDALLGKTVKDFDLEVHYLASGKVLELLRSVCEVDTVGMSFGVIKVKHFDLDISLPRRENKNGAGHRGFLVETDPDLNFYDASARRDFTVNAIMYDPLDGELIDPHHGVEDLRKKVLRHVSEHFSEDPLRVLRGMQFVARLEFSAAPETLKLCTGLDQHELAIERIGTEWEKLLLQGKKVSYGLEFLKQSRWIRFYPELEAICDSRCWEKLCRITDNAACARCGNRQKDLLLMTAAFCACLTENKADTASAGERFCRRLWNRHELIKKSVNLAESFREWEAGDANAVTPPVCRRLSHRLNGLENFITLLRCAGNDDTAKRFFEIASKYDVLMQPPVPLVGGMECAAAGITPGPLMGMYLKLCFDAQLDGEFDDLPGGVKYLEILLEKKHFSAKGKKITAVDKKISKNP